MPNIAVLIKHVPDTWSTRTLKEDHTLNRAGTDEVIDEINERSVEAALLLTEAHGGEVTVFTVGPDRALDSLRKAVAMGAHNAVLISDEQIAGSDVVQTAYILAAALAQQEGIDLVITGNSSTDGNMGALPGVLAEYLGLPCATHLASVNFDGTTLTGEREAEDGTYSLSTTLPAIISVTEKANTPRFAKLKGIMAAKKKEIPTKTLGDLGIATEFVGLDTARSSVSSHAAAPPKSQGTIVTDDGTAAAQLADFLAAEKFL